MFAPGLDQTALREKQQIQQALHLISIKYSEYIAHNPSVQTLMTSYNVLVKFMATGPFMMNLRLSGQAPSGCTVNGFTDYLTHPPTIYINRGTATPATLVHELLHYLTHANFREAFKTKPDVIEGVTEYFTRKVLGRVDHGKDLEEQFNVDRTGIYDTQHGDVTMGRGILKGPMSPTKPPKDFMKKAYFLGDHECIEILKQIF